MIVCVGFDEIDLIIHNSSFDLKLANLIIPISLNGIAN